MQTVKTTTQVRPGLIFSVRFVKKDGTVRFMKCRSGVHTHTKGGELSYKPEEKGLKLVYDMLSNGYRMINVNGAYEVVVKGKTYLNDSAKQILMQL